MADEGSAFLPQRFPTIKTYGTARGEEDAIHLFVMALGLKLPAKRPPAVPGQLVQVRRLRARLPFPSSALVFRFPAL